MLTFLDKFIAQIKLFFRILSEYVYKHKSYANSEKSTALHTRVSVGEKQAKLLRHIKNYLTLLLTGSFAEEEVAAKPEGVLGICINSNNIILIHVLTTETKIVIKSQHLVAQKLKDFHFKDQEENEAIKGIITAYIKANNLTGIAAAYVLPSSQYVISLVELSEDPKSTREKQILWGVKDYLNYSIDDAILESFDIPMSRTVDNVKLAYAVVTRAKLSQDIGNFFNSCGVCLKYIDIHELSLRNIIALFEELSQTGCLVLKLFENYSSILLIKNNSLFISRITKLNIRSLDNFDPINDNSAEKFAIAEGLLLELQRSLDYGNNMFRGANFNKIVFAPNGINLTKLIIWLKDQSGLAILPIEIDKLIISDQVVEMDLYGDVILALGAALRSYNFTE